jgi:hypothetical protein
MRSEQLQMLGTDGAVQLDVDGNQAQQRHAHQAETVAKARIFACKRRTHMTETKQTG